MQDVDRVFSQGPSPPPTSSRHESSTPTPKSSTLTPGPSSKRPTLPKRAEKKELSNVLKRAFEDRQVGCEELTAKRIKAINVVKLEKIAP